ncbi:MAG: DUF6600 domain-containing protein [Verrucomicrobiota bacterium]
MYRRLPAPLAAAAAILLGAAVLAGSVPLRAQDDNSYAPPPPTQGQGQNQGQDGGQGDNAYAPPPPPDQAQVPDQGQGADQADTPTGATVDTGDGSVTFQTFYDSLAGMGTWIQTNDYGYVWQPQVTDPDWAPYTVGHWVYTDAGWTWDSDEPWGWATYHYGRWVNLDGTGWVWVPGYTWGPAWVSWRYGDGYAGWAPLPPDSFAGIDYYGDGYDESFGFHIGGDADDFYGIGPALYVFIPVNYLCYRHYHGFYSNRHDNFALINHTVNVTNINVTRNNPASAASFAGARFRHVTAGGPQLAQVNAVSAAPFERLSLVRSNDPGARDVSGTAYTVFAPHVRAAAGPEQPARVAGLIGQARINRGTDVLQTPAVNAHLAPAPATAVQVEQARAAASEVPAGAKVLTDAANVRPVLNAPLTSLQPAARPIEGTRAVNAAPGAVFSGTQPVFNAPRSPGLPGTAGASHIYTPGPVVSPGAGHGSGSPAYAGRENTGRENGAGGAGENHVYARPSAPAYSTPAPTGYHPAGAGTPNAAPSGGGRPAGGGYSGGGYSGGHGGGAANGGGHGR